MAVCIGYGRFGLGLLLPDMKADLGLSYAMSGLLVSLNLAAYLAGVWLAPKLARRLSHIRIVQAGLVLAAAGMVCWPCRVSCSSFR
jgi:cyanate permease